MIKAYSKELGVKYPDMNRVSDYVIDFENDFKGGGNHENIFGAKRRPSILPNIL